MGKEKRYSWIDNDEIVILAEGYTSYGYEVTFIENRFKKTMVFASEEEAHEYFQN